MNSKDWFLVELAMDWLIIKFTSSFNRMSFDPGIFWTFLRSSWIMESVSQVGLAYPDSNLIFGALPILSNSSSSIKTCENCCGRKKAERSTLRFDDFSHLLYPCCTEKMKIIEKNGWNAFTYFLVDDKVFVFEILRFLFRHKYNFLIASPLRVHVTRRCHLCSFVNLFWKRIN